MLNSLKNARDQADVKFWRAEIFGLVNGNGPYVIEKFGATQSYLNKLIDASNDNDDARKQLLIGLEEVLDDYFSNSDLKKKPKNVLILIQLVEEYKPENGLYFLIKLQDRISSDWKFAKDQALITMGLYFPPTADFSAAISVEAEGIRSFQSFYIGYFIEPYISMLYRNIRSLDSIGTFCIIKLVLYKRTDFLDDTFLQFLLSDEYDENYKVLMQKILYSPYAFELSVLFEKLVNSDENQKTIAFLNSINATSYDPTHEGKYWEVNLPNDRKVTFEIVNYIGQVFNRMYNAGQVNNLIIAKSA